MNAKVKLSEAFDSKFFFNDKWVSTLIPNCCSSLMMSTAALLLTRTFLVACIKKTKPID